MPEVHGPLHIHMRVMADGKDLGKSGSIRSAKRCLELNITRCCNRVNKKDRNIAMASLFSRAFVPPHSMLLQLPAPLRQCSALHASLLARQANRTAPTTRLFHLSPVVQGRKPSRAIVRPVGSQQPQPRPRSSTLKKVQQPLPSHPQTTTPQSLPQTQRPTSNIAANPHATYPQLEPSISNTDTTFTTKNAIPLPPHPAQAQQKDQHTYLSLAEKLALRSEPTTLYTAPPQTAFILACITSAVFLSWVSFFTWKNYEVGIKLGNMWLGTVAVINCSVFLGLAAYIGWGPAALVKRIVAVPPAPSAVGPRVLKPTLRIELVTLGKWAKPIEVDLADVRSDRSFAYELERIAASPESVFMRQYFGWVVKGWNAYLNMFARASRFTYIRAGNANFKLDLRGCETPEQGRGEFYFLRCSIPQLLTLCQSSIN